MISIRYISYYQLRNADYLDSASTQEARETVKQWIVSRGAVEAGFYFSEQKKESCYYQEQKDLQKKHQSNHLHHHIDNISLHLLVLPFHNL